MDSSSPETAERCFHAEAQLHLATQGSMEYQRILVAIRFVENNLYRDLVLNEVAAVVQLSLSRFNDLFKEATGLSPARYIKQLRMEAARQLLATGFPSTTEVMDKVGIKDYSHFSRDFRKLYGITPAQYRDYFPRAAGNTHG